MKLIVKKFQAYPLKEIRRKAGDKCSQFIENIVKLTYFDSPENKNHWITELTNHIDGAYSKPKGGEFDYNWIIEPETSIDEGDIKVYLENLEDDYKDLMPKRIDLSLGVYNVYRLVKLLNNRIMNNGGKKLNRKQIQTLINELKIK